MPKFIAAALASAALAFPAAAETIRVGMSGGYFPFTFVRQDVLQGFEVDFMNAIAAETGDEGRPSRQCPSPASLGALEAGGSTPSPTRSPSPRSVRRRSSSRSPTSTTAPRWWSARATTRSPASRTCAARASPSTSARTSKSCCARSPTPTRSTSRTYESNIEQDTALGRVDAFVMDRVWTGQVIAESPLPLAARRPALLRNPERPAVPKRRRRPGVARPRRRRDHHAEGERDAGAKSRRSGSAPTSRPPLSDGARPRVHAGPRPGHPALRAADPRHGGVAMAIALVLSVGVRGRPSAEGAGGRRLRRASSSASSAARRCSCSSSSSTTGCRRCCRR